MIMILIIRADDMDKKTIIKKFFQYTFAIGSTLAIGLLSFAGMFVFSASFWLCGAAFILATVYEGQVNNEGIKGALQHLFDDDHLPLNILRQHLEKKLEERVDNPFLKDYRDQKRYLEQLEAMDDHSDEHEEREEAARIRLKMMEMYYLKQFQNPTIPPRHQLEKTVADLLNQDRIALQKEIQRKKNMIRASMVFAVGGGLASGLATLSAIKVTIATFAVLSVIPGGAIFTLGALAAVGYTLLLYQNMADLIQEYGSTIRDSFKKRNDESQAWYAVRVIGITIAVGLAIFATIATAGTWWNAAKNGAAFLGSAASAVRSVAIALFTIPSLIFGVKNSLESIDGISKSQYGQLFSNTWQSIKEQFKKEDNILRSLNPFRAIAKAIEALSGFLLVAHVASMGLISDRLANVNPAATLTLNGINEIATDLNYLPNKSHDHSSFVLSAFLFIVVKIPCFLINLFLAMPWDLLFTRDIKKSKENIFGKSHHKKQEVIKPRLSPEWQKHEVIAHIKLLGDKSKSKAIAANETKADAQHDSPQNRRQINNNVSTLSTHRNQMWSTQAPTANRRDIPSEFKPVYGF